MVCGRAEEQSCRRPPETLCTQHPDGERRAGWGNRARARPAYWRQPRKGTNLCVGLRLGPRRSRSALQLALSHQHTCFLQILLIHLTVEQEFIGGPPTASTVP